MAVNTIMENNLNKDKFVNIKDEDIIVTQEIIKDNDKKTKKSNAAPSLNALLTDVSLSN